MAQVRVQVPSGPARTQRLTRLAFEIANDELCPVDSGRLRASFRVRVRAGIIHLRWKALYASYVNRRGSSAGYVDRIILRGLEYQRRGVT